MSGYPSSLTLMQIFKRLEGCSLRVRDPARTSFSGCAMASRQQPTTVYAAPETVGGLPKRCGTQPPKVSLLRSVNPRFKFLFAFPSWCLSATTADAGGEPGSSRCKCQVCRTTTSVRCNNLNNKQWFRQNSCVESSGDPYHAKVVEIS